MKDLVIQLLNTGQGNCAFIRYGEHTALIDARLVGGPNDLLKYIKRQLSGKALNYLIVSHPHKDHIQGLRHLLRDKDIEIEVLVDSRLRIEKDEDEDYPDYDAYLEEVSERQGDTERYHFCKAGVRFHFGDAMIDFLTPDDDYADEKKDAAFVNRHSAVVKVSLPDAEGKGGKSVLFLADTVRETFETDLKAPNLLRLLPSDVVVASHHGSKYFFYSQDDSNCEEDAYVEHLETMSPDYTYISCSKKEAGEDGPPHKQALELYSEYGGEVFRADEYGSVEITIRKDGTGKALLDINPDFEITDDDSEDNGGKRREASPIVSRSPSQLGSQPKGFHK